MNGIQYNIALSLFFIPYILLEGIYDSPIIKIESEHQLTESNSTSPVQPSPQEVQATLDVHRHSGCVLGNRNDLHRYRKELHRPGHLPYHAGCR